MTWADTLPVIFMALMGLSMLAYVVLDGYDLGVGLLLHRADDPHKDTMIASIGPFWDANETWLVLGVGILLIAFPKAHGMILTALYLPVALMLVGLILRGVAFDFRVKAEAAHKPAWNFAFFAGSGIAAASQGWMLGRYITGFGEGWQYQAFAAAIALLLPAAYVLLGAGWLIMKTDGDLQRLAVRWAKLAWAPVVVGMGLISLATPLVSSTVRSKWFAMPELIALLPIPLMTLAALVGVRAILNSHRVLGKVVLAALRADRDRVRARRLRPGLQPVPVRGDGPADAVAGGQRHRIAGRHRDRLRRHGAGHRRLHGVRLPRVLGQGGHAAATPEPGAPRQGSGRAQAVAAPWHFLNFLPLPQGQGSLRPGVLSTRRVSGLGTWSTHHSRRSCTA